MEVRPHLVRRMIDLGKILSDIPIFLGLYTVVLVIQTVTSNLPVRGWIGERMEDIHSYGVVAALAIYVMFTLYHLLRSSRKQDA